MIDEQELIYSMEYESQLRESELQDRIAELEAINAELEKASSYSLLKQNEKLKAANARLREAISDHNSELDMMCANNKGIGRCDDYNIRKRDCPDCPRDYRIEALENNDE